MAALANLARPHDDKVVMVLSLSVGLAQRLEKLSAAFKEDAGELAVDAIDLFIDQAERDTPIDDAGEG